MTPQLQWFLRAMTTRRSYFLTPSDREFLRGLRIAQDDVTTETKDANGARQQ